MPGDAIICKVFNMGKCKGPCRMKDEKGNTKVHFCNWEMPDGTACGV